MGEIDLSLMRGAEPFLLPGGDHGVLLVHGFTGAPGEVKLLGEHLQDKGYTVLGPRLCGHGARVEEMSKVSHKEWYGSVEDGYYLLSGLCKSVSVVGLSMGGLLSLKLSAEYPVSKVVSLSTPIFIADRRLPYLPYYRMIRSYSPKKKRRYKVAPEYLASYDKTPLKSVSEILVLIKEVKNDLAKISVPLLIIQAKNEHTVRPESARYIYGHVGSEDKEIVWLERSGHMVTLDIEKEFVFDTVANFLAK